MYVINKKTECTPPKFLFCFCLCFHQHHEFPMNLKCKQNAFHTLWLGTLIHCQCCIFWTSFQLHTCLPLHPCRTNMQWHPWYISHNCNFVRCCAGMRVFKPQMRGFIFAFFNDLLYFSSYENGLHGWQWSKRVRKHRRCAPRIARQWLSRHQYKMISELKIQ